jgi:hypothetical protein
MRIHATTRYTTVGSSRSAVQTAIRSSWVCRAPLVVAAGLIFIVTAFNLVRLVTAPAPRNPWEATEVVEAWRSSRGLPVYELGLVPPGCRGRDTRIE